MVRQSRRSQPHARRVCQGGHSGLPSRYVYDEAEGVIRARTDIEEPSADLMQAYDCNDLLPEDSEFAYADLAPGRLPVSYYIDTRDHHLLDVGLDYGPAGAHVGRVMYWNFIPEGEWDAYLADTEGKFGKPDLVQSDKEGMKAIWCETGDAKCADDYDFRHRIVLSWGRYKDRDGEVRPSGRLFIDKGYPLEEEETNAFAQAALSDQEAGKKLFEQCRYATQSFTEQPDFERHLGNMVGILASWSSAISEPRMVDAKFFLAVGLDGRKLIADHDCAMRRQSGLRDMQCNDQSPFRWMRNKDELTILAMRDVSVTSHRTQSGSLSTERLIYCLIRHEPFGSYDLIWSGESLIDLSNWLAAGEQRNRQRGEQCTFTS